MKPLVCMELHGSISLCFTHCSFTPSSVDEVADTVYNVMHHIVSLMLMHLHILGGWWCRQAEWSGSSD